MSDFFRPVIVSSRLDSPVIAAVQSTLIKAQQTLSWLPNLTGESASIFYGSPPKYPNLNPTPEGLTEQQRAQWKLVWDAMQPISSKVLRGEMQAALIDSQRLSNNLDFWNSVHRVTTAVATVGGSEITPIMVEKWQEMVGLIKEWRQTRDWALKIAAHPDCPPDKAEQVRAKIADLDTSIGGKVLSLTAQVPGIKDALKQEGLSGIPAALASLATVKAAVTISAILAVVGIVVYCISSVKSIINDLGLQAVGEAVRAGQKMLGPWLGVAIFGGIGYIIYRKMTTKK